ncbi:hypothetical protein VW35_02480 [Devosia soli]|uniref:Uncharacterized protein n=1 Tax=Devosia soli TaxID=361041 RepID=A0A0F5LFE4_9HYPH|nr:hypothetical protein [Devosia soli]KKB81053.1 hypothetical protein VW35_02480 [Devosia soli]
MSSETVSDRLDQLEAIIHELADEVAPGGPEDRAWAIINELRSKPVASGVEVKPLDWTCIAGHDGHFWRAPNPFGGLPLESQTGEQKARHEADYRNRILSALEPATAPVVSEPVAQMRDTWDMEGDPIIWLEGCETLKVGDYLYASPQPQPKAVTEDMVERLAVSVFDQTSDNDTVPWERQPGRVRNQTRKQVRQVLTALRIHAPAALEAAMKEA